MRFIKNSVLVLCAGLLFLWLVMFVTLRFTSHNFSTLEPVQLAKAEAYFERGFEPMPTAWSWGTFTPETGVTLRTGVIEATNPKGTIVIVPGFTSPIEMNARAINAFNSAGYRVAAIDYRGQGGSSRPLSNPEKGYVEDYAVLANDVADYAKQVRVADKPLFIFAISKGAHISLRLAEKNTAGVSAYALAVPMIEISAGNMSMLTLEFVSNAATMLGLGAAYPPGVRNWPPKNLVFGESTDCNANPKTAQIQDSLFALKKSLRVSSVTMRWIRETIKSSKHIQSKEFVDKITEPIKIFNAGDDRIVNADSAKEFCDSLSDCSLTQFPKARHCINREDYEVFDQILEQSIMLFNQV